MAYQDKTLTCGECGAQFVFTAGEQEFYASRGFAHEPRRCPSCREARRSSRDSGDRSRREMYTVVCAQCGQQTQVPFQPRGLKPVYCSECFKRLKATSQK